MTPASSPVQNPGSQCINTTGRARFTGVGLGDDVLLCLGFALALASLNHSLSCKPMVLSLAGWGGGAVTPPLWYGFPY